MGINVSTKEADILTTFNDDNAKVKECPIVKAVTKINTFFQSLSTNTAHNAITNRM